MAEIKLLLATHNAHKTREIREILGARFSITDLNAHPGLPATVENGATLEENAALKAIDASRASGDFVLADDSGLEVDALGGAPGVRSARFAGDDADDAANRRALLDALKAAGARGRQRSARFRCVLALARAGAVVRLFHGVVEGTIINRPRGRAGFGYDSLFVPQGHCRTFAELPAAAKNAMSHRARALAEFERYFTRTDDSRGAPFSS